ncbi:endodeoxyribonuclease [Modicella reniformis]|uniref:DNA topoisomerase (ATP-hydrolyzing) n=1 Tax=Modicella reniformis TaxID=1440133 RepID=A0A9P6MLA6_9FUNG|nr:endodeoxyribonuclease [Modicella reniformis]
MQALLYQSYNSGSDDLRFLARSLDRSEQDIDHLLYSDEEIPHEDSQQIENGEFLSDSFFHMEDVFYSNQWHLSGELGDMEQRVLDRHQGLVEKIDENEQVWKSDDLRFLTKSLNGAEPEDQDISHLLYSDEATPYEDSQQIGSDSFLGDSFFHMEDVFYSDQWYSSGELGNKEQRVPYHQQYLAEEFLNIGYSEPGSDDGLDQESDDPLEFSDFSAAIPSSDSIMPVEVSFSTTSPPVPSPFMEMTRQSREWVLQGLETLVFQILYDLSMGRAPSIDLCCRSKADALVYDEEVGVIRRKPDHAPGTFTRTYRYGNNSASSLHSIVRIIDLIHDNVYKGSISTKRDLFYREVTLFGSQTVIDKAVEDIACTLRVPRSCLNVVAGTRSVVFGSIRLTLKVPGNRNMAGSEDTKPGKTGDGDDSIDKAFTQSEYNMLMAVPSSMDDILRIEIHPQTKFILVIEKEATMNHLISLGICASHGPCILLTSKGYPDMVARQLLKLFSDMIQTGVYAMHLPTEDRGKSASTTIRSQASLNIPILALVDCDPHGIEIFLTYKCGAVLSAYDNANLAVPRLQCIGQIPDDWNSFLRGRDFSQDQGLLLRSSSHVEVQFQDSLSPLTTRERTKLVKLLKRHPFIQRHKGWKRQISKMLMLNRKSELQSLCMEESTTIEEGLQKEKHALVQYLERKLEDCSLWIS